MSATEGLVSAVPSANATVGTVRLPALTLVDQVRGAGHMLDVDLGVLDAGAVQVGLEAEQ